ncbi:MAG: B12-binding domain-containing radical SAM protein [Thermoleophilia bacterium]
MSDRTDCRVLLLTAPKGLWRDAVEKPRESTQPLGIAYIAAAVRQGGYPVEILEAHALGLSGDAIREKIETMRPRIVGISCLTPQWSDVQAALRIARSVDEKIITVVGGPHVTALPEETAADPSVDIAVVGEGEGTIRDICDAVAAGGDLRGVKGIALQIEGEVVRTEPQPKITDLDSLPFPAHDLLPEPAIYNPLPTWGRRGHFSSILSGRGCPYYCSFCDVTAQQGKQYRLRSAENIVDEMAWLNRDFGISMFSFRDPSMVCNRKRLLEICRLIRERQLGVVWNCNSRADEVDLEMLRAMKQAGCYLIKYGIEVGNADMIKSIKRMEKTQVEQAVRDTRQAGISPHGYFMFGFSDETEATMEETAKFSRELDLDSAGFMILVPFPGTREFERYQSEGRLLTKEWREYDYMNKPVYRNANVTSEQIIRAHRRAYRGFYLRPRILALHLRKMASPPVFFNYLRAARQVFK